MYFFEFCDFMFVNLQKLTILVCNVLKKYYDTESKLLFLFHLLVTQLIKMLCKVIYNYVTIIHLIILILIRKCLSNIITGFIDCSPYYEEENQN